MGQDIADIKALFAARQAVAQNVTVAFGGGVGEGKLSAASSRLPPRAFSPVVSFNAIPLPIQTAGAGNSWWYPLLNRRVADLYGSQEMVLLGGEADLLPMDTAGLGSVFAAGTAQAWGTTKGEGGAIVVGVNLPVSGDGATAAWSQSGIRVPRVEPGNGVQQNLSDFAYAVNFPTGTLSDTVPNEMLKQFTMPGTGLRLRQNDRICVALVVAKQYGDAAAARVLCGGATVHLRIASADDLR